LGIAVCGYLFGWKWTGLPNKTLWDWLNLLIVPAVLALGGYFFTRSENRRTREDADQQRSLDREIAEERRQDEALQAYLDQMSGMLIPNKDQPSLYKAQPGDGLSSVARARTLTVLPRLDGDRKTRVAQFLYESGLIPKERPVLDLRGANLREADLSGAGLSGAGLSGLRQWTEDQLSTAETLEGTTMPDSQIIRSTANPEGPTFDEWLKGREGRKEDAGND